MTPGLIAVPLALLRAAINPDAGAEVCANNGPRGTESHDCTGCGARNREGWGEPIDHKEGCSFVAKRDALFALRGMAASVGDQVAAVDRSVEPTAASKASERELLTAAARTAGGELCEGIGQRRTGETWESWEWYGPLGISMPNGSTLYPLTLHGDAMLLSTARRMTVAWEPSRGGWSIGAIVGGRFQWLSFNEECKLAIVQAAAVINGRA
jgi:hypothetical protein